jgi:hypothetical protein
VALLYTPHPPSACLAGFLRSRGLAAVPEGLALALAPQRLSREGTTRFHAAVQALPDASCPRQMRQFEAEPAPCAQTTDPGVASLHGRDASLAHRIVTRTVWCWMGCGWPAWVMEPRPSRQSTADRACRVRTVILQEVT